MAAPSVSRPFRHLEPRRRVAFGWRVAAFCCDTSLWARTEGACGFRLPGGPSRQEGTVDFLFLQSWAAVPYPAPSAKRAGRRNFLLKVKQLSLGDFSLSSRRRKVLDASDTSCFVVSLFTSPGAAILSLKKCLYTYRHCCYLRVGGGVAFTFY